MDQDYDKLLSEYCGFRAGIIMARACCDTDTSRGYPPVPVLSAEERLQQVARHIDAALARNTIAPAPYRLIDLRDGSVWDFQTAEHVTDMLFVRTMWHPHAAVYKHGVRWRERLIGDVGHLAQLLDQWQPTP